MFGGRMIATVFLMICLAGLSGCSGTYGRLVVNSDVKALFERNEVLPDHRYYHTGKPSEPKVVVGLHEEYALLSDYWHPVELTPELLGNWLRNQTYHLGYYLKDAGAVILDKEGRKIGVLYGIEHAHDWAAIQTTDDKRVSIILPIPRMDSFWWDVKDPDEKGIPW